MMHVVCCQNCDRTDLDLDSVTANIRLSKTSFCSGCHEPKSKDHNYHFCSAKCLVEWVAGNKDKILVHAEGLRTEPDWPYVNVDGVLKNILTEDE